MQTSNQTLTRRKSLNQLMRYIVIALVILPRYITATTIETPIFSEEYFNEYYKALADYTVENLQSELYEAIDDILSSGSHMSAVSQDYKTRHIETSLLNHLREQLCVTKPIDKDITILKRISANSVASAGSDAQVKFNDDELGILSGITVRLVEKMPQSQLCNEIK